MSGGLRILSRRLEGAPDPLSIYAALAAQQEVAALFETADSGARESAESLIFVDPWISLESRNGSVRLVAHPHADPKISAKVAAAVDMPVIQEQDGTLVFDYPRGGIVGNDATRLQAGSVFDPLRRLLFDLPIHDAAEAANVCVFGCFAYDLLDDFESLPGAIRDPTGYPDYSLHLAGSLVRIDHRHAHTTLYTLALRDEALEARRRLAALERLCHDAGSYRPGEIPTAVTACLELDDAAYARLVDRARQHINEGDIYQIVPARAWTAACADPVGAYARLRIQNPSPYMFCLQDRHGILFGASPESALKVDAAARRVEIRPIAGTRERGWRQGRPSVDAELDARLELELRLSEKEIAEHVMLVDLARNDIARVAIPGSRRVDELMRVERYSHVMHLVSRVSGELMPGLDALHAYQATLNMGTLTGAPKLRAAELLRRYEPCRRGPYGGAVGYLTAGGDLDTAIVIRSALVRSGSARIQAGAGIVADSNPVAEADETRRKAQAVLQTLGVDRETTHVG